VKVTIGDFCVVAGCVAGAIFVGGMQIGEYKARESLATVCEPQPGATLAASYQDRTGIKCSYMDNAPTIRQLRKFTASLPRV
jgi:hypothetical protein